MTPRRPRGGLTRYGVRWCGGVYRIQVSLNYLMPVVSLGVWLRQMYYILFELFPVSVMLFVFSTAGSHGSAGRATLRYNLSLLVRSC